MGFHGIRGRRLIQAVVRKSDNFSEVDRGCKDNRLLLVAVLRDPQKRKRESDNSCTRVNCSRVMMEKDETKLLPPVQ